MTRKELSSNNTATNATVSNESESFDKNEIIQKYVELNDACDKILERISKGSKGSKKHSKNRSK